MNILKKSMVIAAVVALSLSSTVVAKCLSCAEKMAIKQSVQAAMAALANKPAGKHVDTLEDIEEDGKPCCESCANGGTCEGQRCPCSKPSNNGNKPSRAERDGVCCNDNLQEVECLLEHLMQKTSVCCKEIHHMHDRLKKQGHEAEKCCRSLKNRIEDVEDLVVTLTDQEAACCSVIEGLVISQIDQQADCCSVIETRIGDLCNSSVIDTPFPGSIVDVVDASCLDMVTWLKSIYALVAQIYYCTCNLG